MLIFLVITNKRTIRERYNTPIVGENELSNRIEKNKLDGIYSKNQKHALFEFEDIEVHLKEAESLMSLGEYQKAKDVFSRFFIPQQAIKFPDMFCSIAVNYALTLYQLGDTDGAITIIKTVEKAKHKSAEYYVNLSLFYLAKNDSQQQEMICREGLKHYSDDIDLIGNLTIALSWQDKLEEAQKWALKRIKISRDVHSLEEAASVVNRIAERYKNVVCVVETRLLK